MHSLDGRWLFYFANCWRPRQQYEKYKKKSSKCDVYDANIEFRVIIHSDVWESSVRRTCMENQKCFVLTNMLLVDCVERLFISQSIFNVLRPLLTPLGINKMRLSIICYCNTLIAHVEDQPCVLCVVSFKWIHNKCDFELTKRLAKSRNNFTEMN